VDDIPTLANLVDAVLLLSLDGCVHLEQVKPVLAARKPVFIDKPLADNRHATRMVLWAEVLRWIQGSIEADSTRRLASSQPLILSPHCSHRVR
jgi:hypothetical protein